MFTSAGLSFLLYLSIILKFRGNILVDGWNVRFRRVRFADAWKTNPHTDSSQVAHVMKQMMWYVFCPHT